MDSRTSEKSTFWEAAYVSSVARMISMYFTVVSLPFPGPRRTLSPLGRTAAPRIDTSREDLDRFPRFPWVTRTAGDPAPPAAGPAPGRRPARGPAARTCRWPAAAHRVRGPRAAGPGRRPDRGRPDGRW